jgi:hypothetical protein
MGDEQVRLTSALNCGCRVGVLQGMRIEFRVCAVVTHFLTYKSIGIESRIESERLAGMKDSCTWLHSEKERDLEAKLGRA